MLRSQRRLALAVLGLVGLQRTAAQVTSNATCFSNLEGLYNSKGQSPCLVAAYLGSACNGGQYDVSALIDGQHYVGPTTAQANPCLCNTVIYSVMGACSTCQNGTIITWDSWSAACSNVYIDTFPEDIPADSAVPGWAYENVTITGLYNVTEALDDDSPESTATHVQTTQTAVGSSSSPGSTLPASGSGSGSNGSHKSSSNTGAIAGGVVGGVVGAALIGLGAFFLWRRNRANANARAAGSGAGAGGVGGSPYGAGSGSPMMGARDEYAPVPYTPNAYGHGQAESFGGQPKLYDPSDPSTFPTSPEPPTLASQHTGHTFGGAPHNGSGFVSVQNSGGNQGMYRGVAEV
ncbi:hypothetical protein M0805_000638 [Coniferiporia weirii]|nr:hypothetical protein M0805_000638 [Coniferiporia weirii]